MREGSVHADPDAAAAAETDAEAIEEVLDGQLVCEVDRDARLPAEGSSESGALPALSDRTVPAALLPAVAASSFLAGAAIAGIVHRRRLSTLSAGRSRKGLRGPTPALQRGGERLDILGSRSFLLDVHLLGGRR